MARTEDREINFILNMSRAMAEYTCDEHRDTAVHKADVYKRQHHQGQGLQPVCPLPAEGVTAVTKVPEDVLKGDLSKMMNYFWAPLEDVYKRQPLCC